MAAGEGMHPPQHRRRVPVAALLGLSLLLGASVVGILVGTGTIAFSSGAPSPLTPAGATERGSDRDQRPGRPDQRSAHRCRDRSGPPDARSDPADPHRSATEPVQSTIAGSRRRGCPAVRLPDRAADIPTPVPERLPVARRLSVHAAERLPVDPGMAVAAAAAAALEASGARRLLGLLRSSRRVVVRHRASAPASRRVDCGPPAVAASGRGRARGARLGARAPARASWNSPRASRRGWRRHRQRGSPRSLGKSPCAGALAYRSGSCGAPGRRVDAERVDRALRALAFVGPDGEIRADGVSLDLARLHVGRALAQVPSGPILESGARLAARVSAGAAVVGVCALGLVVTRPWSVLEGADVLLARAGIAPVDDDVARPRRADGPPARVPAPERASRDCDDGPRAPLRDVDLGPRRAAARRPRSPAERRD